MIVTVRSLLTLALLAFFPLTVHAFLSASFIRDKEDASDSRRSFSDRHTKRLSRTTVDRSRKYPVTRRRLKMKTSGEKNRWKHLAQEVVEQFFGTPSTMSMSEMTQSLESKESVDSGLEADDEGTSDLTHEESKSASSQDTSESPHLDAMDSVTREPQGPLSHENDSPKPSRMDVKLIRAIERLGLKGKTFEPLPRFYFAHRAKQGKTKSTSTR